MKRILFRADDLGYSEAVNYGIEKSVKEGLVMSVGVMVNMPAALHGVELLIDTPAAFSLHTNISAGRPLSKPEDIPSLVGHDGMFKSSKEYRSSDDFVVKEEVMIEIEAQYRKFIELFDRKPDYFEGHAVNSPVFFDTMEYFAEIHGLKYSGIPEGEGPNALSDEAWITVGRTKVYLTMESMKEDYDPYRTLDKIISNIHEDGVEMMICHPGYLDDYILNHSSLLIPRTQETAMLTDQRVAEKLRDLEIEVVSYREL